MQRNTFLRQAVSVAVCVWTVLLLVLRFSPGFVQTELLTDDSLRSYTVPAVTQTQLLQSVKTETTKPSSAVNETESAVLPLPVAGPEKTDFPTQAVTTDESATDEHVFSSSSAEVPTGEQVLTQPATTLPAPPTEAQSSPATTQSAITEDITVHTKLPVATDEKPADTGEPTLRPLRFGAQVTTALPADGLGVAYILNVTERGYIQYTLGYSAGGPFSDVGWKLTLYEEYDRLGNSGSTAYRRLNILNSSVAADSVTSSKIGVQPGTYRLVLEQNGAFSNNVVTVLADFAAETDRECEPNDTPARYTELYPGYEIKGSSGKYETATDTDEDWYLFRMPYDGYASYTFTHEAMDMISVSWQIFLYDADLNQLSFNNANFSEGSITGEQVGLGEGMYFICVKGRVHSTQDYVLKVDCVRADLYEQESNDSFATATPLATDAVYNGMMNNRSQGIDYDYYAVTLTRPGSLKLVFRHAAIDEDEDGEVYIGWNISLFTAAGDLLYSGVSDWKDTVNLSPEMGVAAGTYYVCIDSDNRYFTPEPYTISVEHTNDRDFESEPNDTADLASEAFVGSAVRGSLTQAGLTPDVDYFIYSVVADTNVTLTFSHEKVNLDRHGWVVTLTDVDGKVYTPMDERGLPFTDANGALKNQIDVNWNQSDVTAHFYLRAGEYYVRVEAGDYFSSETYSLLMKKK